LKTSNGGTVVSPQGGSTGAEATTKERVQHEKGVGGT